jgi:O-glycosyl hydrolase
MSPLNRDTWMGVQAGSADVQEYAEWMLAQVRRYDADGAPLDYISLANEPSYSRNTMSAEFIRDVIKALVPRLRAEGLLVPFVIPDDVRASDAAAKARIILADPAVRPYIGALATHLYDQPISNLAALQQLAQQYRLPLWMSEFTQSAMSSASLPSTPLAWAQLMHTLLSTYNVSAIDYLWGFAGGSDPGGTLISLKTANGNYQGFTPNKAYYYFGQYSRFIRPGAQRVSVTTSQPDIQVSAYYRDTTRILVAINPTNTPITTRLTAPDLQNVTRMTPTRTTPTENWNTTTPLTVNNTTITITLEPQSTTTLTGTTG